MTSSAGIDEVYEIPSALASSALIFCRRAEVSMQSFAGDFDVAGEAHEAAGEAMMPRPTLVQPELGAPGGHHHVAGQGRSPYATPAVDAAVVSRSRVCYWRNRLPEAASVTSGRIRRLLLSLRDLARAEHSLPVPLRTMIESAPRDLVSRCS